MAESDDGIAEGEGRAAPYAGVTVFRPERHLLLALVDRLVDDGLTVLVHVDGPTGSAIDAVLIEELRARSGLGILQSAQNIGLGASLNLLAAEARRRGGREIVLYDQDSTPPPGLAAQLSASMRQLQAAGRRPAVVGPRPVQPEAETGKPPRYVQRAHEVPLSGLLPVNFVITSGSLVDLAALASIGPFREDYWIDGIDTEWCFRAWHRGHSVWLAPALSMAHRIGHGVMSFGPLRFPRQNLSRMSTYFRNQVHSLGLPHVPRRFKLRQAAYLPLQAAVYALSSQDRIAVARRLGSSAMDGWRGRLGAPRRDGNDDE